MNVQKISISLPQQQYDFVEYYQAEHHYKNRSEVIRAALSLLQQKQLETCYQEANKEIDTLYDITAFDGMNDNETW